MSHTRTLDPPPSAACLGAVLRRLRTLQGLTQADLGRLAGYGGSYISAVERAAVHPSHELVERCDQVLEADGVLLMLWSLADAGPGPPAAGGTGPAPEVAARTAGQVPTRRCSRRWRSPGGRGVRAGTGDPVRGRAGGGPAPRGRRRHPAGGADPGGTGPARLRRPPAGTSADARAAPAAAGRRRVAVGAARPAPVRRRGPGGRRGQPRRRVPAGRPGRHAELAAWAVEALALWALADGRYRDALELARAGQDLAPPASAAAVQLALDEAQAWTSLGDRGQAAGARRQAALTRAMLPAGAS